MTDSTTTETTTTETTTAAAGGTSAGTVLDLRPASTSVKRQLLRLGLTYNSRQGDQEVWYEALKNLQATIPDKDSTSCTLFDATSGETRTVTATELEGVDSILTAQDGLEAA